MARWTDLATWRGPTVNQGGRAVEQRGVVVHIAEGTYEGTIAWQRNPSADVSSHFVVAKDGRIAQMVDTDVTAWTQRVGNGHWLSIENEGHTPSPLTAAQVEANAKILARWHKVYGGPLQLATSPSGRGLGHHSMGAESGVNWGHSDCPGPSIKAQKPGILARAIQIANGEEDDMPTADEIAQATVGRMGNVFNRVEGITSLRPSYANGKTTEQNVLAATLARLEQKVAALAGGNADVQSKLNEIDAAAEQRAADLAAALDQVDEQVVARLGAVDLTAQQKADLLRPVLGDDAAAVGSLLAQG